MTSRDLLGDLARVLARDPPLEEVFETLRAGSSGATSLRSFAAVIDLGDGLRPVYSHTKDVESGTGELPTSWPSLLRAVEAGAMVRGEDGGYATAAFPLRAGSDSIGAIALQSEDAGIGEAILATLETAALYLAAFLANRRLAELATRDALTQLANRRAFDARLAAEWSRAAHSAQSLALILVDVDYFHAYNARYGHVAGDLCLQKIARGIAACAPRPLDLVARYGGEEFVMLLPGADERAACEAARHILVSVSNLALDHASTTLERVTVSLGVAAGVAVPDRDPTSLVELADHQLYEAKNAGRNRYVAQGHRSDTPANHERFDARHNMPSYITTFVGREMELAKLERTFRSARLATLVGPPGAGKTRLATRFAERYACCCQDGARLIELASLHDSAQLISALANVFGIREATGEGAFEALLRDLRDVEALVLLDTCEHLLGDSASTIARLLLAAPRIRVLATSREPFSIAGECVVHVGGLPPEDARQLFLERARRAGGNSDLPLDPESLDAICRKLDRLPLALELVAGHVREILEPGDAARVLSLSARAPHPRQESLYHAFDWSYRLLSEQERRLFRRLSVFALGGRVEAVREVCKSAEMAPGETEALLGSLERKSLVATENEGTRFRMLQSTAAYASQRLQEDDDAESLRDRFARYYAKASKRLPVDGGDPEYQASLIADRVEIDNYVLALRRLLPEQLDARAGADLLANLAGFLGRIGRHAEGRRLARLGLRHEESLDDATRGRLHRCLAVLAYGQADPATAERAARDALAAFERAGDEVNAARCLQTIGSSYYMRGNFGEARDIYGRCLEVFRRAKNPHAIAAVVANLGAVETDGYCNHAVALAYADEAVDICRRIDLGYKLASSLLTRGQIKYRIDETQAAVRDTEEACAIFERIGHPLLALALSILARCRLRLGEVGAAREALRGAAGVYASSEPPHYVAYFLETCAWFANATGKDTMAAELTGFAERYRSRNAAVLATADVAEYDGIRNRVCGAIGAAEFERRRARGASTTLIAMLRECVLL